MISGSVTVETLPVDASIPQSLERQHGNAGAKTGKRGNPGWIRDHSNTHHLVESAGQQWRW